MWFKLQFGPYSLRSVVGKDASLYWRLVDIGHLLKKANPNDWANRIKCSVRAVDVLPEGFHYPKNTLRCQMVTTGHVMHLLPEPIVTLFRNAMECGKCRVYHEHDIHSTYFRNCVLLVVDPENGNANVGEWVQSFVEYVQHCRQSQINKFLMSLKVTSSGRVDSGRIESGRIDSGTSGIIESGNTEMVDSGTTETIDSGTTEMVDSGTAGIIDSGTTKMIGSGIIDSVTTEMVGSGIIDSVTTEMVDSGTLEPKMLPELTNLGMNDPRTAESNSNLIAKKSGWWLELSDAMPKKFYLLNDGVKYEYALE